MPATAIALIHCNRLEILFLGIYVKYLCKFALVLKVIHKMGSCRHLFLNSFHVHINTTDRALLIAASVNSTISELTVLSREVCMVFSKMLTMGRSYFILYIMFDIQNFACNNIGFAQTWNNKNILLPI